jgi:hypothetical protein
MCTNFSTYLHENPATFVLHHPEHGHAVVLPIISCIIDGSLVYDKTSPPFASLISLVCPKDEVQIYSSLGFLIYKINFIVISPFFVKYNVAFCFPVYYLIMYSI